MNSANSKLVFTSILAASLSAFSGQQSSAATLAAAQATEMLARAQAIQQKCKFLSASQHETLSNFVARAEIAMVFKSSAKITKTIIANGRAQGQKAACSDTERADIIDIINAAQQATAANKTASPKPVKSEKPIIIIPASRKTTAATEQKSIFAGGLAQYAQLTKRYYLARRCNFMSPVSINSLYRNVVTAHRNVVSNFGIPAVRKVMQQSEQSANNSSCS